MSTTKKTAKTAEIIEGILRVEEFNEEQRKNHPEWNKKRACKNTLGTWICERCGKDVRETREEGCQA